jgi:very-short-patch-repair endonuclease
MSKWIIIAVALVLIAVAFRLLEFLLRGSKRVYRYDRKASLMTNAERDCYHTLVSGMGNTYTFFPQVHLDCILAPTESRSRQLYAFRHINQKSVDFVACDKENLRPLFAIELDDKTHSQPRRIARDKEVERIFQQAGIPLIRITNRGRFDAKELALEIQRGIERLAPIPRL